MSAHVVAVVLLVQLSLPLIEVSISFVHPWVSALAKRGILLMVLSGCSGRYFSLQAAFMMVQSVHHRVVFVQEWVRSPTIQQSRERSAILIAAMDLMKRCPCLVLNDLEVRVDFVPRWLILHLVLARHERLELYALRLIHLDPLRFEMNNWN